MNIFKLAYKNKRDNSDEIYLGFGFRHLSDATLYYVHPNNQSFKGTTTLAQSIGEAITLFSLMFSSFSNSNYNAIGDIYVNDDNSKTFVYLNIPQDWMNKGVVPSFIYKYRILVSGNEIVIGAYDVNDAIVESTDSDLLHLYKLLPCFIGVLAEHINVNDDFNNIFMKYIENPAADIFVNIHEDFYQDHKNNDYSVFYKDIKDYNTHGFNSYLEVFKVVKDNKLAYRTEEVIEIDKFHTSEFTDEQRSFIPNLPAEFVMPTSLNSVCKALVHADSLAVLLHGPSGTGKTISCKLICREIGLPIMDTINCTENLDEFVLGKYIPEGDKIIFKESYVTKAIAEGGAVVFEEINFAKPAYLAFLNSLLDDNGFVRLDNGKVVKRHKNFRFFATMNLGYFGTKELNQALYNRFNNIVEIAKLSDESIIKMLKSRVPECSEYCDKILGVYHKLKKKIEQEELDLVISPRNLENWARLAKYEGYLKAAEKTIVPIAKCDRVFEETIRGILMLYKW